jgi:hypothetical protein
MGEIDGDAKLTITTVATATVSVTIDTSGDASGANATSAILVTTTDATNAAIDKREVSWRLYGAAGTSADASRYTDLSDGVWEPKAPTCSTNGDARIHPMPPLLPGGFGLGVRVAWATHAPQLFTSFTKLDVGVETVSTTIADTITSPCAIEKHGATTKIACLDTPTSVATYAFDVPTHVVTKGASQDLGVVAGDSWIAVISVDETNGDQDAYALSSQGLWVAIDGAPAAVADSHWCTVGNGVTAADCNAYHSGAVQYVPACGDAPAFVFSGGGAFGASTLPPTYWTIPVRGGAGSLYDPALVASANIFKLAAVTGAGCITELQLDGTSKLRQALVFDSVVDKDPVSSVVFPCSAATSPCVVPLPTAGQAVAFPLGAGGHEPQLVGGVFDATGTQLAHWVVKPDEPAGGGSAAAGAKDRLVERSRQSTAAPPRQLVSGKFDADSDPDLFWTFTGRASIGLQIAYARTVAVDNNQPLSAETLVDFDATALKNPDPVQVLTGDFNGDGYDEIVLVYQGTASGQTATLFDVVPTGVPYSNPPAPPDDPTCN